MPRDLATSSSPRITSMTSAEIAAALHGPTGVIDTEYEIRTYDGKLVDLLPKAAYDPDTGEIDGEGVIDAPGANQFEMAVESEIPGTARMRMTAIEDLRHKAEAYEIWPWMIEEFDGPSGTRVTGRWQLGAWPMRPPTRTIEAVGHEIWALQLQDRSCLLDGPGPGLGGWTTPQNRQWKVDIQMLLERGGIDPSTLVAPDTGEKSGKFIYWTLKEPKTYKTYSNEFQKLDSQRTSSMTKDSKGKPLGKPLTKKQSQRWAWLKKYLATHIVERGDTSLLHIIYADCEAAGWERMLFDWSGRPVIRDVQTNFDDVQPDHTYQTGPDSIIMCPVTDLVDTRSARNRAFGLATGANSKLVPVEVKLEEIAPGHPLCMTSPGNRPGFYRDLHYQDSNVATQTALRSATIRALRDAAHGQRTISWSSLYNPGHEPYDFAKIVFEEDEELAAGVTTHSRRLAVDASDHTMTHQHFRLWDATL